MLSRQIPNRDDLLARGNELGIDLTAGATVLVVRAHPRTSTEVDWRQRLLAVAGRGARSVAPGSISAPSEDDAAEVVVLVPDSDGDTGRRATSWTRPIFFSAAGRGLTAPNRFIALLYAGVVSLAVGVVALGVGLLTA